MTPRTTADLAASAYHPTASIHECRAAVMDPDGHHDIVPTRAFAQTAVSAWPVRASARERHADETPSPTGVDLVETTFEIFGVGQ